MARSRDVSHGAPLHFTHPIVGESPSPDTKVRFDAVRVEADEADSTTLGVEAEYAFTPGLSALVEVPYAFVDPAEGSSASAFGSVGLAVKLASFALASRGLLLGGGLELGLPTGDDGAGIGSSHELQVAPFVDFGYATGPLELVGRSALAIPTNQNGDEEGTALEAELSLLWQAEERLAALLELDGEGALSGEGEGRWNVALSPGVRLAPFSNRRLVLGLSVGFPLDDREELDSRVVASLFWHL